MPPKFTLGVPKNTFPPVADPLAVVFKAYVNVVLLVAFTENTPFKLALPIAGTPVISTVVGMPGTMPVSVAPAVTVTTPDESVADVIASDVDG